MNFGIVIALLISLCTTGILYFYWKPKKDHLQENFESESEPTHVPNPIPNPESESEPEPETTHVPDSNLKAPILQKELESIHTSKIILEPTSCSELGVSDDVQLETKEEGVPLAHDKIIESKSTSTSHISHKHQSLNLQEQVEVISITEQVSFQKTLPHHSTFTDSESSGEESDDEWRRSVNLAHSEMIRRVHLEELTVNTDSHGAVTVNSIVQDNVTVTNYIEENSVEKLALSKEDENMDEIDPSPDSACSPTSASEVDRNTVQDTVQVDHKLEWTSESLVHAGVPSEDVPQLLELCTCVGAFQGQTEPLSDPITLLRFLNSREKVIKDALAMYRDTIVWRQSFGLYDILSTYGDVSNYCVDKSGSLNATGDVWEYSFPRKPTTAASQLISKIRFYHTLDARAEDDAPIAIWRLGSIDFAGIVREGLETQLRAGFLTHLEEMLQLGRAASSKHHKLVRCRLIIDGTGLGLGMLQYIPVLKLITGLGKAYFPETTASATIVNAPWVFARLFGAISPMLTPVMRAKVCILDTNFETGLSGHSGVDISVMPMDLGGNLPAAACPYPEKVPTGAGAIFRQ